jgi:pyruvate ferredoxin oxidoreductase delta subunit
MKLTIGAVCGPGGSRTNRTGAWRSLRPRLKAEACNGCSLCSLFCPDGCVFPEGEVFSIDYTYCKGCGICAKECPSGAIEMVPEEK